MPGELHVDLVKPGEVKIVRQTSLAQEGTENPLRPAVHVVVKNQPFMLQAEVVCFHDVYKTVFNFQALTLVACLVYDTADYKPVDYLRKKPLSYQVVVSSEGQQANIDLQISTLSSQHEGTLFRVRLDLADASGEIYPGLSVMSSPIKVISKPAVLKTNNPAATRAKRTRRSPPAASNKRLKVEDVSYIVSLLEGIVEQQQEQKHTIDELVSRSSVSDVALQPSNFKQLFTNLLLCYSKIPETIRLTSIQEVAQTSLKLDAALSELTRDVCSARTALLQ